MLYQLIQYKRGIARPDKTTPNMAAKGVPKYRYQAEPTHPVQTSLPSRLDMLKEAGTPRVGMGQVIKRRTADLRKPVHPFVAYSAGW